MPETDRITLTLRVDQIERLEGMADNDDPRWRSKSEAARHILDEADRVDELEEQLERLQNEKKVLIDEYQENEESDIVPQENGTTILDRLSWLIRGK